MFQNNAPISVLYPLLDNDRFTVIANDERRHNRRLVGISDNEFVLCCHCNMRPIKRPELVIELAERVCHALRVRLVLLLMVGPTAKGGSRENIVTVRDGGRLVVWWTGIADRVESYLNISDVAVNLSAHDSFNASLLEAMACGVPVASTNVVGIAPEIIASGGGAVFSDNEMNAMVDFICTMARDEGLRCKMGLSAAKHAREVFATERWLNSYVEALFPEELHHAEKG
jgi:glycosyltransferase involved in cell wall biosynthesis